MIPVLLKYISAQQLILAIGKELIKKKVVRIQLIKILIIININLLVLTMVGKIGVWVRLKNIMLQINGI
tara:strand:+ start:2588 stop:2794 length:207 start_codon:yes stop_codon:yes gene_type:complete